VSELVLDTSAVLALLNEESGGTAVAEALERDACLMSCVNVAEVAARLGDRSIPEAVVAEIILSLNLSMVEFDFGTACQCGALRPMTRSLGLSLGDRACLALALERGCPALTADRAWAKLGIGVDIRVIR
jgi:PIN domain nuclease of toxin-antitoxin system